MYNYGAEKNKREFRSNFVFHSSDSQCTARTPTELIDYQKPREQVGEGQAQSARSREE